MIIVKCNSDICKFNKEGICKAEEVELYGNKLRPTCQTIEWDPEDVVWGID